MEIAVRKQREAAAANPYGDQASADPEASGSGENPFKKAKTNPTRGERQHAKWLARVGELRDALGLANAKANTAVHLGHLNDEAHQLTDIRTEIIPPWNND
eukprot:11358734-Heterocapsa_arctica.AAC.1